MTITLYPKDTIIIPLERKKNVTLINNSLCRLNWNQARLTPSASNTRPTWVSWKAAKKSRYIMNHDEEGGTRMVMMMMFSLQPADEHFFFFFIYKFKNHALLFPNQQTPRMMAVHHVNLRLPLSCFLSLF